MAMDDAMEQNCDKVLTFADLFSGIGGMRLAFESVGAKCVFSCESDKFCAKTYVDNFGVVPAIDLRDMPSNLIPDHDILVGGFPCQPFSTAGLPKRNSLGVPTGFEDKVQGTLFFEVCRIIRDKRPKVFLLENVKGLLSINGGKEMSIILDCLKELGYAVYYKVLDGQLFVPQHRERLIIVGFDQRRYEHIYRFSFDIDGMYPRPILKDILINNDDVPAKYTISDKLWNWLKLEKDKNEKSGNGFGYTIAPVDGISRTLSARYHKDGSEILIAQEWKNPRRLTPRECARLQGFPDSFKIVVSDTQAYKQFGNSVVVPLIAAVAELIKNKLESLEDPNN